jgi:hypothetical protein
MDVSQLKVFRIGERCASWVWRVRCRAVLLCRRHAATRRAAPALRCRGHQPRRPSNTHTHTHTHTHTNTHTQPRTTMQAPRRGRRARRCRWARCARQRRSRSPPSP